MRRVLAAITAFALVVAMSAALPAMAEAAPALQEPIDSHDDTRVEVQLVVLAIAFVLVVVIGTAGYILRRRLGLVPPPPEQEADHH